VSRIASPVVLVSLEIPIRRLKCDDDKRPKKVDREQRGEGEREANPGVPRPVPIPRPLPETVHAARLNRP
jgi:hypothetical protein